MGGESMGADSMGAKSMGWGTADVIASPEGSAGAAAP